MVSNITRSLFVLLKQAIPEIPDDVTKLSIELTALDKPVITYTQRVEIVNENVVPSRTFRITGIEEILLDAVESVIDEK